MPLKSKGEGVREDYSMHRARQYKEELTDMTFSVGGVLSQNKGRDVRYEDLSSDQTPYTGPNQGFYAQNKAMVKKVSK